ncbi:MAG TPA: alanine racemase [Candidatus Faecousia excrementipullorum]|nr:alanine racemase [Candidatus Faecousia excrementipullorum]
MAESRPESYLEVSLGALRENAKAIVEYVQVPVIGVVKCDGYGMSLEAAARAWVEAGAFMLGVSTPREAQHLRRAGFDQPMLLMAPVADEGLFTQLLELDVVFTLSSPENAQNYLRWSEGKPVRVHVAVDTGMGRFGIPWENTQALKELYAQKGFSFEGIFSHFAKAFEGAYTITKTQLERFLQVTEALRAAGCPIGIRHIANSNAALRFPQTRLDAVRVGSALTGRLFPKPPIPLRPAARYLAQVVECKTLQKGDTTGYAAVCRVQKTTRAAIVAVGSENGYGYVGGPDNYLLRDMVYYFRELFRLSRKLPGVTYQGKRLPLVGRVGNQYTLFDASGTDIHPGDYVEAQVPTVIPRTNLAFVEE